MYQQHNINISFLNITVLVNIVEVGGKGYTLRLAVIHSPETKQVDIMYRKKLERRPQEFVSLGQVLVVLSRQLVLAVFHAVRRQRHDKSTVETSLVKHFHIPFIASPIFRGRQKPPQASVKNFFWAIEESYLPVFIQLF